MVTAKEFACGAVEEKDGVSIWLEHGTYQIRATGFDSAGIALWTLDSTRLWQGASSLKQARTEARKIREALVYVLPRVDQRLALAEYAKRAGENWKASLRADWMRAGSRLVDTATYTLLHQLRNSHGPKWLAGVPS